MDSSSRVSRPSLAQVKAVVQFMQKHPELAHKKHRSGARNRKCEKLWVELANIANSTKGAIKSTKGWIKFWSDKRRNILMKQKQIKEGKIQGNLYPLEKTILDICNNKQIKTRRKIKEESCDSSNDNFDDSDDEFLSKPDNELEKLLSNDNEERQLNIMEKLVDFMGQQAAAMTQMAQSQLNHSKSFERFAEASHIQALAVDRLASTFENISSSIHDVRNALVGIDYTMKRCYTPSVTQLRPNANIFS